MPASLLKIETNDLDTEGNTQHFSPPLVIDEATVIPVASNSSISVEVETPELSVEEEVDELPEKASVKSIDPDSDEYGVGKIAERRWTGGPNIIGEILIPPRIKV